MKSNKGKKSFLKRLTPKQLLMLEVISISLIILVALLFRLKFVFGMEHSSLVTDAYNYDIMTRQFLDKGFLGYMSDKPGAYITPGYPFFLSLIYLIFGYKTGSPIMQVRVVQSLFGAFTCLIVYFIGKKAKNKTVGFIAAAAYAIYPTFAWSPSLILTETIYNFFFLLYIYFQVKILETKSRLSSFVCGLIFAIAVMIRPLIFPLLIIPFAYHYVVTKDKRVVRIFIYTAIGVLLVMLPWWIRNMAVLEKFILLATQTGNPFIAGMFPYFDKIDITHYNVKNQIAEGLRMLFEGLRTQPLLYIKWFTIGKLNFIFGYSWFYPEKGFTFLSSIWLLHFVIIVLGWLGVLFSMIKGRLRVIALFAIILTLFQLLFVPEARYAYSIMPLLMILMAYTVEYLFFSSREV